MKSDKIEIVKALRGFAAQIVRRLSDTGPTTVRLESLEGMTASQKAAYEQGYGVSESHGSKSENRYPKGTELHAAWDLGFDNQVSEWLREW